MARFLGVGCTFKSPMTTRTYVVSASPQWQELGQPVRPPAHIIGVGGFGATYRVVDDRGETFAMKEFFPRDHATRGTDGRITPKRSEDGFSKKIYEEGLRRFVAEGRLLTAFSHPNVLRVVDAFDDSGTSYQLMRLVEGREQLGESDTGGARIERRVTFEDFLRELEATGVPIDLPLIRPVLKQLLDAVEYIHTEGSRKAQEITGTTTRALLHRDIKPSNILIEAPDGLRDAPAEEILRHPDTKAILIDFGSARIFRDVQQDDVSRSIGVVTEGYAPPELKDNDIDSQGPHSDIYSIAAVIWRALTGRKPTTAQLANGAKLAELAQPIVGADGKSRPRASQTFLQAVDRALSAGVNQRPQSVAQWRAELGGQAPAVGPKKKAPAKGTGEPAKKGGGQAIWWWLMTAGFIGVSAYTFWQHQGGPTRAIEREADAAAGDADSAVKIAEDNAVKVAKAASTGAPLIADAEAKAKEGKDRWTPYAAYPDQDVVHNGNQGDEALGDKLRTLTLNDGGTPTWWCFKKRPEVTPEKPYETYTYKDFTVDGDPGWACGITHTHHAYSGPKNPWHIQGKDFTYDGEVNDQLQPSGLGVLNIDTHTFLNIFGDRYEGRFETKGTTVNLTGGQGSHRLGQFQFEWGAPPKLTESLTAVQVAKLADAQVQTVGDRVVLVSTDPDGKVAKGLVWKDGFVGLRRRPDGQVLRLSGPTKGRVWGRLEQGDAVYRGQISDDKPDGCGVWTWRDKSKETGFYLAGVKQSGELPADCTRPHYIRPIDIDAVARSGAEALPQ